MPAHNTIPHTAWRCTATRSHRTGEGERGRESEWDTVEESKRGKKEKTHSLGTFRKEKWITMRRRVDWSGGRPGGSGSVALKTDLLFPPYHAWEAKDRRNNFRWALTPWSVSVKKKKVHNGSHGSFVGIVRIMQITCNKLHPSPLLWLQHTAQARQQSHSCTHCIQKAYRLSFIEGGSFQIFTCGRQKTFLPEWDRLSDQAICD